ncbi:hypothetical protein Tco_0128344 [Tanacetum coccineum]
MCVLSSLGNTGNHSATKGRKFQVVIDLIKNSSCFKAFTISADVPEIFMQQFWYSIKKVQGTDSYEFLLANKKCVVNADVFRTILDICPKVEGVNFTDVPDDDTTLAFLIKLGYKENVNYPELIWEDLAYLIDHWKEKRSRCENMPFPRFTKMFIKYSTGQIPPKMSKGKGSQRKKTADDSQEIVDVSEEFEPKPEPVKRKTCSKRRVTKKVTLSVNDNIISDDPDTALELGKSISKTEAEEVEAARQGVPSLTPEEQEAADIMQALKESKRQPGTKGSSEGTGTIPGVPVESTVISATSSEGTESEYSEEYKLDDEEKDDKEGDADDEDDETESDEDDIYKYKIRVRKDEDEEITVKDTTDVEINSLLEVKIQSEVPHIQSPSMLRVPVYVIPEPSFLTPIQESHSIATITTLPPLSVSTTPYVPQQITTSIPIPTIITDAPIITTVVSEFDALFAVYLRVAKLEKDVSDLKKIDLSTEALAALKTQVSSVVDNYLGSKVGDLPKKQTPTVELEQEYEKSPSEILKIKKEQNEKQKMSKFSIKSKDQASLKEYD